MREIDPVTEDESEVDGEEVMVGDFDKEIDVEVDEDGD